MNFGEYLRTLLLEKNVNLTVLAKEINIKSKNELYRLFANKYSYEKCEQLTKKILEVVPVDEKEKEKLFELMEHCRIGIAERSTNEILSTLYKKNQGYDDVSFEPVVKFINKYKKHKISIMLGSLTPSECIMLSRVTENCTDICIDHIINFNTTEVAVAESLFSFIKLFEQESYHAYEGTKNALGMTHILVNNGKDNILVIYDKPYFIESKVSDKMAQYIKEKFVRECRKKIKESKGQMRDYIDIVDFSVENDTNDVCSLYGMQCIGDLPYETLYALFRDADYWGFPPEHEFVKQLNDAVYNREQLKKKCKAERRYCLSEKIVDEFLSTGRTLDYLTNFRPLNEKERSGLLGQFLKDNGGLKYRGRFYKEEFEAIPVECVHIENSGIYISASTNKQDKISQWALITHPKAVRVFKSFTQWMWENCTLSDEESKNKLIGMINMLNS